MEEYKKGCQDCKYFYTDPKESPCKDCIDTKDNCNWELNPEILYPWLTEWLSSFDTSSATKCFEAVQLLKQRLEGER